MYVCMYVCMYRPAFSGVRGFAYLHTRMCVPTKLMSAMGRVNVSGSALCLSVCVCI